MTLGVFLVAFIATGLNSKAATVTTNFEKNTGLVSTQDSANFTFSIPKSEIKGFTKDKPIQITFGDNDGSLVGDLNSDNVDIDAKKTGNVVTITPELDLSTVVGDPVTFTVRVGLSNPSGKEVTSNVSVKGLNINYQHKLTVDKTDPNPTPGGDTPSTEVFGLKTNQTFISLNNIPADMQDAFTDTQYFFINRRMTAYAQANVKGMDKYSNQKLYVQSNYPIDKNSVKVFDSWNNVIDSKDYTISAPANVDGGFVITMKNWPAANKGVDGISATFSVEIPSQEGRDAKANITPWFEGNHGTSGQVTSSKNTTALSYFPKEKFAFSPILDTRNVTISTADKNYPLEAKSFVTKAYHFDAPNTPLLLDNFAQYSIGHRYVDGKETNESFDPKNPQPGVYPVTVQFTDSKGYNSMTYTGHGNDTAITPDLIVKAATSPEPTPNHGGNNTPAVTPPSGNVTPTHTEMQGGLIAVEGDVVYSTNHIYMYAGKTFNKKERLQFYTKKPRVYRPMFVVKGYERSKQGRLRYYVRDVNHHSSTYGMRGYITANTKYVLPVYYRSMHKQFTVISPLGVNEYKNKNLTGKVKNHKQGTTLKVKGITSHNLASRYILLSDGNYITGNRKLIQMGKVKQPKQITVKRTIKLYSDVNFKYVKKYIRKGTRLTVKKYDYSHKYSTKYTGAKRYFVAGGYVTANSNFVKVTHTK